MFTATTKKMRCLLLVLVFAALEWNLASAGVGSYFKEPRPAYGSPEWHLERYNAMNTSPRPKMNPKKPDELFFGKYCLKKLF